MREGAGILFVSRSRPPMFLVGRESYVRPSQHQSATWGDFGGMCKRNEPVELAAAREAWEETGGLLYNCSDLTDLMKASRYVLKLTHQFDADYRYTLFVVDINLDCRRNVQREFDRMYSYLKARRANPDYMLEKCQMEWLSLGEVERNLERCDYFRTRFRTILAAHWDEFAEKFG